MRKKIMLIGIVIVLVFSLFLFNGSLEVGKIKKDYLGVKQGNDNSGAWKYNHLKSDSGDDEDNGEVVFLTETKDRKNYEGWKNESPSAEEKCETDWKCDDWSECNKGLQTRVCVDDNNCGILLGKPIISRTCCSWSCGSWGECMSAGIQIRDCTYHLSCEDDQIPETQRNCEAVEECFESWTCDYWSDCVEGVQTRNCTDVYNCGTTVDKPITSKICPVKSPCNEEDAISTVENLFESFESDNYDLFSTLSLHDCKMFPSICRGSFENGKEKFIFLENNLVEVEQREVFTFVRFESHKDDGYVYNVGFSVAESTDYEGCRETSRYSSNTFVEW